VTAHGFLSALADSFNPLLAIVALAVPFLRRPQTTRATVAYYLSTGAAIGIVYLVRFIDSRNHLWASFGLDYSTHSAFAASLAASLGAFDRRLIVPLVVAVLLYFALEIFMRYHGIMDILSSAIPAAIVAILIRLSPRLRASA
jgi:hypothetical protein